MANALALQALLKDKLAEVLQSIAIKSDRVVIEIAAADLKSVCYLLRDDPQLQFASLMDIAGVDYSQYGVSEWETTQATASGFSRGVESHVAALGAAAAAVAMSATASANSDSTTSATSSASATPPTSASSPRQRFGVVYQLLSITHNHRLTLRTFASGEMPMLDSVIDVWPSANWNEREVFDLFGVLFRDHPDLRRILTDYGFIGYPFRKDFPLSGEVEVRYDATTRRVVYEPVDIKPRVLVPKVIRAEESYLNNAHVVDTGK